MHHYQMDDNTTTTTTPIATDVKPKEDNPTRRRQICTRCKRPLPAACICQALPANPITLDRTSIVVLQHPHEVKMKNRSIPILELCLDKSSLALCVGRKLDPERIDPSIFQLFQPPNLPILFFPPEHGETGVISLSEAKEAIARKFSEESIKQGKVVIVALDATWKYAKEMHRACLKDELYPSNLMRVCLQPSDFPDDWVSGRFTIRTTPKGQEGFMSTVECLAWAASELGGPNNDPDLFAKLMKPLDLMVAKWNAFVKQPKVRKQKSPRKRRREEQESS